jgi:hypothetical protein
MLRLDAGHDRNGNGRRAFVALSPFGDIVGAWKDDEGVASVPESLRESAGYCPTYRTTVREIKDSLRFACNYRSRTLAALQVASLEALDSKYRDVGAELRAAILKRGTTSVR